MSLPALEELDDAGMWDTSGEASNTKTEGLQHKYAQTTLILSTSKMCYVLPPLLPQAFGRHIR